MITIANQTTRQTDVNCHEEVFIAEQLSLDGETVPDALLNRIAEFEPQHLEKGENPFRSYES